MAIQGHTTIEQHRNEVTLSRIFDAPRDRVFSMFKDPERVSQWWGPTEWPVRACRIDFRPGGTWHYCMEGPDGQQAWGKAVYQEIDEPNRIVFTDFFSDAEGHKDESLPEAVSTVTFEEEDGRTTLTMRGVYPTAEDLRTVIDMGMLDGMRDTWDQLDRLLQYETRRG